MGTFGDRYSLFEDKFSERGFIYIKKKHDKMSDSKDTQLVLLGVNKTHLLSIFGTHHIPLLSPSGVTEVHQLVL